MKKKLLISILAFVLLLSGLIFVYPNNTYESTYNKFIRNQEQVLTGKYCPQLMYEVLHDTDMANPFRLYPNKHNPDEFYDVFFNGNENIENYDIVHVKKNYPDTHHTIRFWGTESSPVEFDFTIGKYSRQNVEYYFYWGKITGLGDLVILYPDYSQFAYMMSYTKNSLKFALVHYSDVELARDNYANCFGAPLLPNPIP